MDDVKQQGKLDWEQRHRKLQKRHARFLKRYDELMQERRLLKGVNAAL